jgi:anti-sigma factor RsiW
MRRNDTSEDQLARLADGSIAPRERAGLEEAVAASPALTAKLAEQQRMVSLVRGIDVPAPHSLLLAVPHPIRRRRPARHRLSLAMPAALAAALVVIGFGLSSNPRQPSVISAGRIALSRATLPASRVRSIAGITFPSWKQRGWQAVGGRRDVLDGQRLATVFYRSASYGRVGYAIASGAPLVTGRVARSVERAGVRYSVIDSGGAVIVTWLRDGHSCVLAERHGRAAVLLALAGWTA